MISSGLMLICFLSGCKHRSEEGNAAFPADFNKKTDQEKVAFVMRTSTPDSVARFVMNAALGNIQGVTVDSLSMAELYIISNYDSQKQMEYVEETARIKDGLSLAQQMKLFKKGSSDDPIVFGLDLGLNYLSRVRERSLSAKDIEKEIKEFKKECGNDTTTYRLFTKGFTEALRQDKDKDVDKDIYQRFINLDK